MAWEGGVFICYHSPSELKDCPSPQPGMSPVLGTAFPQPSLLSSLSRVQGNSFLLRVGVCAVVGYSALGTWRGVLGRMLPPDPRVFLPQHGWGSHLLHVLEWREESF